MYRVFNHWVSGRKTLLFVAESAAIAAACATGAVMLDPGAPRRERGQPRAPRGHHREPAGPAVGRLRGAVPGGALLPGPVRPPGGGGGPGARSAAGPCAGLAVFAMAMVLTDAPDPACRRAWCSAGRSAPSSGSSWPGALLGSALSRPNRVLVVGHGPRAQRLLELLDEGRGGHPGGGAGGRTPARAREGEPARGGATGAGRGGHPRHRARAGAGHAGGPRALPVLRASGSTAPPSTASASSAASRCTCWTGCSSRPPTS